MTLRKRNRIYRKHIKHYKDRNRHHLIPKSRGGKANDQNMLLMDTQKHALWHQLWGNRTIGEVLSLLTRMERMKSHQSTHEHENPDNSCDLYQLPGLPGERRTRRKFKQRQQTQ